MKHNLLILSILLIVVVMMTVAVACDDAPVPSTSGSSGSIEQSGTIIPSGNENPSGSTDPSGSVNPSQGEAPSDSGNTIVICIVTVDVQGNYTEKRIIAGQRLPMPEAPSVGNLYFDGWYAGDEKYDFSKKVTEDFTLTARFLEATTEYLVSGTVRDELGNIVDDATISYGKNSITTRRDGTFGLNTSIRKIVVSRDGYYPVTIVRSDATDKCKFDITLIEQGQSSVITKNVDADTLSVDLNGSVRVKLSRVTSSVATGTDSSSYLKVRYEVSDSNLTSVAIGNNDTVCQSDSVEFYFDTHGDGGLFPQVDDYQIDVSINGFVRFLQGTDSGWQDADIVGNYIITPYGAINDSSEEAYGYTIEMLLPFGQFGITEQSDIHFSLGQSGYGTTDPVSTWNGWSYKSEFVDPQVPAKYRVWGQKGIAEVISENISIEQSYVDGLAEISADKLLKTRYGERIFEDDEKDMLWKNLPENMIGISFAYGPSAGTEVTVKSDGYVILVAPAVGFGGLNDSIVSDGWTLLVGNGKGIGRDVLYETYTVANNVYAKYCNDGDCIDYGSQTIVFGAAVADDRYYVLPWEASGATVYSASEYNEQERLWQGIPSMVALPNGHVVAIYFTGGVGEPAAENYIVIDYSEDGKSFETVCVIDHPDTRVRCLDGFGFLNTDGELCIIWSQTGHYNTGYLPSWEVYITNPTDNPSEWIISEPYKIADGTANNKPTLLSDGSYIMSTSRFCNTDSNFIYKSYDKGLTWTFVGEAYIGSKVATFVHECSIVELADGTLWMLSRATQAPYYEQYSRDGGLTWTTGVKSSLPGAYSRGALRTLSDGKILFVSNAETAFRGKMTAYLIENNGGSPVIRSSLLLDGRGGESYAGVAYPDIDITEGGEILICWDYDRRGSGSILYAIISVEELEKGGTLSVERILVASSLD